MEMYIGLDAHEQGHDLCCTGRDGTGRDGTETEPRHN